jgi:hypothetical protein
MNIGLKHQYTVNTKNPIMRYKFYTHSYLKGINTIAGYITVGMIEYEFKTGYPKYVPYLLMTRVIQQIW